MGEVLRIDGRINYDHDQRPVVQRLRFLQQSPSNYHRGLFAWCKRLNYTEEEVLNEFKQVAEFDSELRYIPGSASYIHYKWLETLDPMDTMTNNPNIEAAALQEMPQAPEICEVRDQAHENLFHLPTKPGGHLDGEDDFISPDELDYLGGSTVGDDDINMGAEQPGGQLIPFSEFQRRRQ